MQLLPVHELYGVTYRARAAFGQRPLTNRVLARKVYRAARLVHLWNKQTKSLFALIEAAERSERPSDRRRAGAWFLSVLMQDACPAMAPFMDQYVPAAVPGGAGARAAAAAAAAAGEGGEGEAAAEVDADTALLGELRALLRCARAGHGGGQGGAPHPSTRSRAPPPPALSAGRPLRPPQRSWTALWSSDTAATRAWRTGGQGTRSAARRRRPLRTRRSQQSCRGARAAAGGPPGGRCPPGTA